jgi:Xaa-Pro aminopeptidase
MNEGLHEYTGFLRFEYVTKVPMCRRLTDESLLSPDETAWLNAYHDDCRAALSPRLSSDARALAWLERETRAIGTA